MSVITFKPKQASKKLLGALPERAIEIMTSRYGLGKVTDRLTLEAIGQKYGITRERVRQIENHSLGLIRKSKAYTESQPIFDELEKLVHSLGGIVVEQDLLDHVSKDASTQNHVNFLLVVGHPFKKLKEDDDFRHRWYIDEQLSTKVHDSLKKLYQSIGDDDIVPESDMIKAFLEHIEELSDKYKNEEVLRRWLALSKNIGKNPLGEWGKTASSNVSARGIRDYAYLVLRRHGSPIHFTQVAKTITEIFKKKAHIATTHNELIKDPRFVLVGRGLYALKEWGYMTGVVKDVIKNVIEKNGPMKKDDVIAKVLKERYVKENTILVNLQNPKFFKKDKEGLYHIV
jgi:hypothetical protein